MAITKEMRKKAIEDERFLLQIIIDGRHLPMNTTFPTIEHGLRGFQVEIAGPAPASLVRALLEWWNQHKDREEKA